MHTMVKTNIYTTFVIFILFIFGQHTSCSAQNIIIADNIDDIISEIEKQEFHGVRNEHFIKSCKLLNRYRRKEIDESIKQRFIYNDTIIVVLYTEYCIQNNNDDVQCHEFIYSAPILFHTSFFPNRHRRNFYSNFVFPNNFNNGWEQYFFPFLLTWDKNIYNNLNDENIQRPKYTYGYVDAFRIIRQSPSQYTYDRMSFYDDLNYEKEKMMDYINKYLK